MHSVSEKNFNRACDAMRDSLSELSREANHAAWLAGHLKVVQGTDGEETFDSLCAAHSKLAARFRRLNEMVGNMIYTPNGEDEL